MIYNLILNSLDAQHSTATASNYIWAIDWSFLPEGKQFKVTTTFQCKAGASVRTYNDNKHLIMNFPNTTNYSGRTTIEKQNTRAVSTISLTNGRYSVGTDAILFKRPCDTPPFYLMDRPNDNFISCQLLNTTGGTYGQPGTMFIILSFEEIDVI